MDPAASSDVRSRDLPDRVLLASGQRGLYGGERQLLLLASGLRRRGVDVAVMARRDGRLAVPDANDALAIEPYTVRPTPFALWSCRRRLRQFRPDVLHYNDSRALTTVGLASLGLPIRLRSAARRVAFPIRSPIVFRSLSDRLLCVSEAVRQRCLEAGLEPGRLWLAPDAVDVDRIEAGRAGRASEALELPGEAPVLLVPASLVPCKGHRVLLEALPGVWERFPELIVLLAGDGPLRSELEAAVHAAPPGRLRVLGYREDLADLLAVARLVVLPSLEEGFGSAIAEAAWIGTPVVASAVGGIPELLGDDDGKPAGWLVPPADPARLSAAVIEVLAATDEAARRAGRARERVREHHHPDETLRATLRAWEPAATAPR